MKYLLSFLWLLPLLILLPLRVEAAVAWESYSDLARTIVSNNFTQSDSWVYMKATGLQKNKDYRAKFYDAQNNNVLIYDAQTDNNGVFLSYVKPSAYLTSSPGTWKAELWKIQPLTLEATDTFTVQESAIPEFPSVFASIGIAGLCFGIYYRIRRINSCTKFLTKTA